jgi:hemoglobin
MQPTEKPSLYDRIGGVYSIATVVDDFINRIIIDPRLDSKPLVDEAHHRMAPAGFKYLVTKMVCWATGGPQKYTGKSMAESHKDLKITSREWEAFLDDFPQTRISSRCLSRSKPNLKQASTAPAPILSSTQRWGRPRSHRLSANLSPSTRPKC